MLTITYIRYLQRYLPQGYQRARVIKEINTRHLSNLGATQI